MIINFYVSSQKHGGKLVVTGVSQRVKALFTLTRGHVDHDQGNDCRSGSELLA